MATTYVSERQIEYWTSRKIEDFLFNAGHQVTTCPIEQRFEKKLPADFLFGVDNPIKLFGIQYKVLYHNGSDYWKINQAQHNTLANYSWIYYGLSDMKKSSDCRNSLHYLRVYGNTKPTPGNFPQDNQIIYYRWAMFYDKMMECQLGMIINDKQDLLDVLTKYIEEASNQKEIDNIIDVFIFNMKTKITIKLSSQLKPIYE